MKKLTLVLLAAAGCTASENVGNTTPNLDDVDAAVYPRVPVLGPERWQITLGGVQEDRPGPIAVAADGDLIIAGTIQSTVDLGYGEVTSPQATSNIGEVLFCDTAFLTKRSRLDGSPQWLRLIRGPTPTSNECFSTTIHRVVVDPSGSLLVIGRYDTTADFGTTTLQSTRSDMFVAKYSSDGDLIWARGLAPDSAALPQEAAVASDGSVAVVGWFRGTFATPSGVVGDAVLDPIDNFVAVFEPDGQMRWARVFRSTTDLGALHCNDIAVAASRDVVVACMSREPFSFGGPVIPVTGQRGMIAKFTSDGALAWSQGIGDETAWNEPPAIAITSAGMIVTVGDERTAETARRRATIRAFDETGAELWMRRAQTGWTSANVLSVLGSDRVFVQGYVEWNDVDFGLGPIPFEYNYLLAVSSDGTPLDQQILPFGQPRVDFAALSDGSIAFTGIPAVGSHPGGFRTDIAIGLLDPPP